MRGTSAEDRCIDFINWSIVKKLLSYIVKSLASHIRHVHLCADCKTQLKKYTRLFHHKAFPTIINLIPKPHMVGQKRLTIGMLGLILTDRLDLFCTT